MTRVGCERIYEEKASDAKENRPELTKLLHHARKGDVVIIGKLDRTAAVIGQDRMNFVRPCLRTSYTRAICRSA